MDNGGENLERVRSAEVAETFPRIKRLFEFVTGKIDPHTSFSSYVNEEGKPSEAIPLPEEFSPLVAEYPGRYFAVYLDDRKNPYYKEGTRTREVGLSTAKGRHQSNERVREIAFIEPDPTLSSAQMHMRVREMVNEKSFATINTAGGLNLEAPHGSAEVTYELGSNGEKVVRESKHNRLDEAILDWKGGKKAARWVRDLYIGKDSGKPILTYKDFYLIGRHQQGDREDIAKTAIIVEGDINSPTASITMEIGFPFGKRQMLYENPTERIKVVAYEPNPKELDQMEILRQDKTYDFLFEKNIDPQKLKVALGQKIGMLKEHWDKPHSVLGGQLPSADEARKKLA